MWVNKVQWNMKDRIPKFRWLQTFTFIIIISGIDKLLVSKKKFLDLRYWNQPIKNYQ
jgi:hypothetical protein